MEESDIYAKLTEIMRDVFDDGTVIATPQLTSEDVKDWDSANHITLVVAVEEAFGIKFRSAELEKMKNVGEMVGHIKKKLS